MIDNFDLFRPSIEEISSVNRTIVDRVMAGANIEPLDLGSVRDTLSEALDGRFADLTYNVGQPIYEMPLTRERKGWILMDGQGVVARKEDEVLVPSLFHCVCYVADLPDEVSRLVLHANYPYSPPVLAQVIKEKLGIAELSFFVNGKIDGKSVVEMEREITEHTGMIVSGHEISEFFGLDEQIQAATLLVQGDNISLLKFSERQLNPDDTYKLIYVDQESPENIITHSLRK